MTGGTMSAFDSAVLDKLRTLDTTTICNIIELFDVRPHNTGYMDARIKACFPDMAPMVGFAATAAFRAAAPPRSDDSYASIQEHVERFAELSGPPVVLFQDLDEPSAGATFGEVMCTTYKAFGAIGLVTSGAGRDLHQVLALGIPIFTNGTICAHGYDHIPQIYVPVHVGGITIYPNDLIHGDRNGITTIPHEIAAEVADLGYEYAAAEGVILEVLRGETPPSIKAYTEAQKEAQARMARLREQVSRAQHVQ
jgi:4-hydroxy-4-methyl-2-oxoglutarate aldolase